MIVTQKKKNIRVEKKVMVLVRTGEVLDMITLMVTLLSPWKLLHFLMSTNVKRQKAYSFISLCS
jgi:hypothetical protein